MADWVGLAGGLLWVLGLAVCLAALSMARYLSRARGESSFGSLKRTEVQLALAAGLVLLCMGLVLGDAPWWEKGIWGLGAASSVVWAVKSWRGRCAGDGEGE